MTEERNALEAKLIVATDALSAAVLEETLEELSRATDGLQKDGRIALSGKADYALSRPRILEAFTKMLVDRLRPRYVRAKRFDRKRAERERPRLKFDRRRGPTTFLDFVIGGTPEQIAKEFGASRPQPLRLPREGEEPEGVPF